MHAVVITEPGGPEVLRWTEVEDPVPGAGEVLVDIVASAVNRADLMQRQGFYPPPPGAPPYPGLECSGTIAATGPGVTGWQPGDEVCALLAGGGYAEKVAVPAGQLLPAPRAGSLRTAAALPETVCTVYSNVFLGARLSAGETLLVHGGASGIGTTAIQLAKSAGATVAVTAGSAEKLEACRELGADILINYREKDFVQSIMDLTDGHGADVILDIMGAAYLARNVDALAADGRIANIGMQGGAKAELDIRQADAKARDHHVHHAASPPEGAEEGHRRSRPRARLAARRRRRDPPGHLSRAALLRGRRGAPDHGGEHEHRQDPPARPVRNRTR